MGIKQNTFMAEFKKSFNKKFELCFDWSGGQGNNNCAGFSTPYASCRRVDTKGSEKFELGDLTASFKGWMLIVEYENKELPLSNIVKYWPYMRGELSKLPEQPVLICHFSDWWSYATRRDLWEWTLSKMKTDKECLFEIKGKQFDHGGSDEQARQASISSAIEWIDSVV